MSSIFGDSHDITFGSSDASQKISSSKEKSDFVWSTRDILPARWVRSENSTFQKEHALPIRKERPLVTHTPVVLKPSLIRLIDSMKSSFLPASEWDVLRIISFSPVDVLDPMFLVRNGESTLLFGTGFSQMQNAGISYTTFPDMRLVSNEKDRLAGWILIAPVSEIQSFQMMLEALGFPHVYWPRDIIANIRESITDIDFLEKCRFFETFTVDSDERKVGEFTLKNTSDGLQIKNGNNSFILACSSIDTTAIESGTAPLLTKDLSAFHFSSLDTTFLSGEILEMTGNIISKHHLKFTFDTFYIDKKSVGVVAGYALKDRTELAQNGVLTFVLEEDRSTRSILGHIFIDSRGFVHSYEMMGVHKSILSWIRKVYEDEIIKNPRLERAELVHTLRREITKYCFLLTGRTPVVMPVILER